MPRNFFRRVESCFPVEDPDHRTRLDELISTYWADNVKSREQNSELTYAKRHPDGQPVDSQALFLERLAKRKRSEIEAKPVVVKKPGKKGVAGGVDQPA
jgi:polyphosphate kinase